MKEIKKLYYSISEVSKLADLKQYVLRYWETEFSQLNPPKNKAGNRTYRKSDIDFILKIKDLLYNQKFTINGARQFLKSDHQDQKAAQSPPQSDNSAKIKRFKRIKSELDSIQDLIDRCK